MSKKQNVFLSSSEAVDQFQLNLKNRGLAALLAWLVPGLGHFYQGRRAKGALFSVCIGSLLLFGIYVGQGYGQTVASDSMINVVHASTEPFSIGNAGGAGSPLSGLVRVAGNHWKFVCQSGIGGVALPSLIERRRALANRPAMFGGLFRPPNINTQEAVSTDINKNTVLHPNELAKWNYDAGFYFELGTVYTVIAGLLNILVVYDAASGPLIAVRDPETDDSDA